MSELNKPWREYQNLRVDAVPLASVRKDMFNVNSARWATPKDVYDEIARRGGLDTVTHGDMKRRDYKCTQYVFATLNKETWANEDVPSQIFRQPLEFLWRRGYEPLKRDQMPENGDIVAYGDFADQIRDFQLKHMGVVDGDGVTSKFGFGHVFHHPLHRVPADYGNEAIYLRKVAERYQVSPERNGLGYDLPFNEQRRMALVEGAPLSTDIPEVKPDEDFDPRAARLILFKDPEAELIAAGYKPGASYKNGLVAAYSVEEAFEKPRVQWLLATDGRMLIEFPNGKDYLVPFTEVPNSYGNRAVFFEKDLKSEAAVFFN